MRRTRTALAVMSILALIVGITLGSVGAMAQTADWADKDIDPICPLQDWSFDPSDADSSSWDSDIIHVTGVAAADTIAYSVFGDDLAVPCSADSVVAYWDDWSIVPRPAGAIEGGSVGDVRIGAGPITGSSFDPFGLHLPKSTGRDLTERYIYLAAKLGVDETPVTDRLPISLDATFPEIAANQVFDPWNPYQIYNASDYLNIRLKLEDRIAGWRNGDPVGTNDLATIVADFGAITNPADDDSAGLPPGFVAPARPDSIVMVGLGRDGVDNDGDWWSQLVSGSDNDPVDVGLDGIAGTGDVGEDDGSPTPGDPYVDENGNGQYDPGETFLDLPGGRPGYRDPGEPFLDGNDIHERGWYEVRTNVAADIGTVRQGYKLDPTHIPALNDPLSMIAFTLLDNGVATTVPPQLVNPALPGGACLQGQLQRPGVRRSLSLGQTTVIEASNPEQRFLSRIDFHEPTVVEFTSIKGGPNGTTEILEPGSPVYRFGARLDFTVNTPSDDDVLFLQMQFKKDTDATWKPLDVDPVGDANGDGWPGAVGVEQDVLEPGWPGYAAGVEPDGIGLADRHVIAAGDTADVAFAVFPTSKNDLTDNDNDAFFTYESFGPGDPVDPTDPATFGRIVWWQIDESKTNGLDDTGDGTLFDLGEASEGLSYIAMNDDNEDGIMDGEKVSVYIDGIHSVLGRDRTYVGPIYVAASRLYGSRTTSAAASDVILQKYYANGAAYTEVVERGHPVVTLRDAGGPLADERRFLTDRVLPPGSDNTGWSTQRPDAARLDAVTAGNSFGGHNWGYGNAFNWKTSKGATLNLAIFSRIYGLDTSGLATAQKYMLRGVACDLAGNSSESWSNPPITFTIDLTPPVAEIIGCGTTTPPATGDFLDRDPTTTTITEIWDAGQHPGSYTLELDPATLSSDVVQVLFQEHRQNADGSWPAAWTDIGGPDGSAPFTKEWPADGQMFTVNNHPAERHQDVRFRAIATDGGGNVTQTPCVFNARVIDSTPPSSWIRGVYSDVVQFGPDRTYEPNDYVPLGVTVAVPVDSSVNVWVRIEDNDRDAMGQSTTLLPGKSIAALAPVANGVDDDLDGTVDEGGETYYLTTMWAVGLDGKTGNGGGDDDGDALTDEDDLGGPGGASDGIYTQGAGPLGDDQGPGIGAGPDVIPGPWYLNGVLQSTDDEWGGGVDNDDYITNDVTHVVFQYRVVNPAGEWTTFATITGDDGSGTGMVYDYASPIRATLNTAYLNDTFGGGLYELRAYACDVEGNCNTDTAPIATINLRSEPLRAYIQPEVCASDVMFDLYAVHFDSEIDKVRSEYTRATAGCCDSVPGDWELIGVDDGGTPGDRRGDAVVYMPGWPDPVAGADTLSMLGGATSLQGTEYRFLDVDDDGYFGAREPVVRTTGPAHDVWDPLLDVPVIGDPASAPVGVTLHEFPAYIFYAQRAGEAGDPRPGESAGLDATDWIFRENSLNDPLTHQLDRWKLTWDATDVPAGSYLVRAIAIDSFNNTDVISLTCYEPGLQNPQELELIKVNTPAPHVTLTTMAVPDRQGGGTVVNLHPVDPDSVIYVPGGVKWVKLTSTDDSAEKVLFEYRIPGTTPEGVWVTIAPNDDDLFYADIDGVPGYVTDPCDPTQPGDELFNDMNGDFVKDPGDTFVPGICANPAKTPDGWALYPRTSGDPVFAAHRPFHVYLDTKSPGFPELLADTQVQIRATAYDEVCGVDRGDPDPDVATIVWGENQAPEAEVIRAEDLNGDLVDVSPAFHDGTPVGTIGGPASCPTDTVRVVVMAQDNSGPTVNDHVDLYYRLDPACYQDVPQQNLGRPVDLALALDGSASVSAADFSLQKNGVIAAVQDESIIPRDGSVSLSVVEMRRWRSMTLAGWGTRDASYPYDFNIATSRIPDGVYQFYPRATDQSGNFNEAPLDPWGFKKSAQNGLNVAFVSTPEGGRWSGPDTAEVGDEYLIRGALIDPTLAPTTAVGFYYAPRKLDTPIDPATVQPLDPFTALVDPAEPDTVLGWQTGDAVTLRIKSPIGGGEVVDSLATYTNDLAALGREPTKYDFTLTAAKTIRFGARPAADDTIAVSYNFDLWKQIGGTDSWSPYTVAWSQADGGIPDVAGAEAYDLIAVATFDRNGDRVYDSDPDACDFTEAKAGEGNYLILRDETRPRVLLYGLAYSDALPLGYPDWNWPGNSLFRSGDDLGGANYENKLSGIETDLFVNASDDGGGIVSVKIDITAADPVTHTDSTLSVDLVPIRTATTIDLPITFYEDDYPQWPPSRIESVILQISSNGGATWSAGSQMIRSPATRSWGVDGRFQTGITDGSTQRYQFVVDPVGDEPAGPMADARNFIDPSAVPGPVDAYSALNVPSTPFWYTHLNNESQTRDGAVHRLVVTATDTFGNTGSNLTSPRWDEHGQDSAPQGPIVFIYDTTPPRVEQITLLDDSYRPLAVTPPAATPPYVRVGPQARYWLTARVSDVPLTDSNVMSIDRVRFEYTPNLGLVWLPADATPNDPTDDGGADYDPSDGGWSVNWIPGNPQTDGYDNDGDGLTDEPEEKIAQVTIRVLAIDDAMNTRYSDRVDSVQTVSVALTLLVDAAEPSAGLTEPLDGGVFGYDDSILLSGTAIGDDISEKGADEVDPAEKTTDEVDPIKKTTEEVDLVRFQAKMDRCFYLDETTGDIGHPDVYDDGVDEVWSDRDGDDLLSPADSCLFPGADGSCFSFPGDLGDTRSELPLAHFWFDLDPTPEDKSDDPWLTAANNGEFWEVSWLPSGFSFLSTCGFGDEYVRLRMLPRDTAGNWDTEADLRGPKETVIILNDDRVSGAYITHLQTLDGAGAVDPLETVPVGGVDPIPVFGLLAAPCQAEVVQVNIYMVLNPADASPETLHVATADPVDAETFAAIWDATALADGEYLLFATAVDMDQNESSKHDAGKIRVRIQRAPTPCHREIPLQANRWEWIGLGLHPADPDAGGVFGDLGSNLWIAKDDEGHVYIPGVYDNLSPLGVENGYAVFLGDSAAVLGVTGSLPSPEQDCIPITPGRWNLIPYLTDNCDTACASGIGQAMGTWADSVIIVQNDDGGVWIPEESIDTIGMLDPRPGYYLFPRATTDLAICYPSCGQEGMPFAMGAGTGAPVLGGAGPVAIAVSGDVSAALRGKSTVSTESLSFYSVQETGMPEIVLVTEANVGVLSEGDEIAMLCEGRVVGAARFQGSLPLVVSVWRGSAELGLAGFTPDAPMAGELFDHETGHQVALSPVTDDGRQASFLFEPYSRVRLSASVTSLASDTLATGVPAILWVRPNPSRGAVEIACRVSRAGAFPELEIYDPAGRLIRRLSGAPREGVLRATWDGTSESGVRVASGVYFLRLKAGARGSEQRLLILR